MQQNPTMILELIKFNPNCREVQLIMEDNFNWIDKKVEGEGQLDCEDVLCLWTWMLYLEGKT